MAKSKTDLKWTNVNADNVPASARKAYDAMVTAREHCKAMLVADARKHKALATDETLAIAFKPWGYSMAKVSAKSSSSADAGDIYANL